MWNLRLFTGKGTRNCATKLPAVLQVWISCVPATMINSNEIWDFSQHKAITIALTKPINPICQCQERNVMSKKCWWGQEADRTTDLSQMCIFETTGERSLQHLGRILCYHVGHYRAHSKWWADQPGCTKYTETRMHGCAFIHDYTHLVSTQSCMQMRRHTCAKHFARYSQTVVKEGSGSYT